MDREQIWRERYSDAVNTFRAAVLRYRHGNPVFLEHLHAVVRAEADFIRRLKSLGFETDGECRAEVRRIYEAD